jgi:hypothetical protein
VFGQNIIPEPFGRVAVADVMAMLEAGLSNVDLITR